MNQPSRNPLALNTHATHVCQSYQPAQRGGGEWQIVDCGGRGAPGKPFQYPAPER